jgi:hypothetical protein
MIDATDISLEDPVGRLGILFAIVIAMPLSPWSDLSQFALFEDIYQCDEIWVRVVHKRVIDYGRYRMEVGVAMVRIPFHSIHTPFSQRNTCFPGMALRLDM